MGVPYSEDCCDDVEIAAEVEWSNILNVPSYITTDWSVDQGDTNIDANNIPLLSYAPNTLASNGTPGLSNFNFNATRKQKLDSIENGAQVNVQANWDETDNTSDSYIHSKPTLFSGSYSDLTNKPTLFSGSYNDLLNKPTIPTDNSQLLNGAGYTTFSGSYNDLLNKPTIPTDNSQLLNGAGYQTASDVNTAISGKQDTLSNGVGVSIQNNTVSIGQSVATSDSPGFTQMSLGNTGVNQGILNLQDFTNIGTETISQIKGIKEGTNGGQIEIFTKEDGGSITKKMVIRKDGATEIYSDGIGLSILSSDGALQQAQIYHGSTGTQDLIIDTDAPATTTKGISFRTQAGVQRLRIGYFGELGFSPTNDIGTSGQILESRGAGNTPIWVNPSAPPPGAFGVFYVNGTLTVPVNTGQQVNNLLPHPSFTTTGMSIMAKPTPPSNTAQTITITDAGTYLFSWNINAQQLSGSTINEFKLYQNGTQIYNNWYIFSGIENIVGSWMVNQATANETYNFLASASGSGHYRLNGFNTQYTQISILKLF